MSHEKLNGFAAWLAFAGLAAAPAMAQPGALTDETAHVVRVGDTLHGLALRYLGDADRWPQLQVHNGVEDARRLRPGTILRIPTTLLATRATAVYVTGEVRHTPPGQSEALPLREGDIVSEGTDVQVGASGFARLRTSNGSLVRLLPGTRAHLDKLGGAGRAQWPTASVVLKTGRVEASVQAVAPKARRRFEIRTPVATASVRGTEFGVELHDDQSVTSEVTQGLVALQAMPRGRPAALAGVGRLLQAGRGARVDAEGNAGQVRMLLAAPDLSGLPDVASDPDFVTLPLPRMEQAAAYRVRVASDHGMEQVVQIVVATGSQVRLAGLPDGRYMVGVRAIDDAGLPGMESRRALRVKAHPVAPLFLRPAPDERVDAGVVALSCAQPNGAQRFRLQVARDEAFAQLLVDEAMLAECAYQTTLAPGHYVWRIGSVRLLPDGTVDRGPFSSFQRFEVVSAPPGAAEPTSGAADERLWIHWPAVPGLRYRVQVARDSAFSDMVLDEWRTETQVELLNQPAGTYYIRLRASDEQGRQGPQSPVQIVHLTSVVRSSDGVPVRDTSGKAIERR